MRKPRILIAGSDRPLRESLSRLVVRELGADVRESPNGPDALSEAFAWLPDLCILAADLAGYDGLQLCHRLRGVREFRDLPVVVMGPRGDQPRKYQAFYVGATEYVELPFDAVEVVCRLRVQLRTLLRRAEEEASALACGDLYLEPTTRTATLGERSAVLTPSEYAVLRVLASRPGEPMSAERLLTEALDRPARAGNPQLIHTHVRNLRKKLEADPDSPSRLTRHPAGYMLDLST